MTPQTARLAAAIVLAAALLLLAVLVFVARGDAQVVAIAAALVVALLHAAQALLPSLLPALVARVTGESAKQGVSLPADGVVRTTTLGDAPKPPGATP